MRSTAFSVAAAFIFSSAAFVGNAAAEEKKSNGDVFINHGSIILMENDKATRFITPKALMNHGRFQIRIKRPQEQEANVAAAPQPTLSERIEARRIMHEANQAYFNNDLTKSWELVAKAEQLDPDFYRIKTMKGSLLYKIGSVDLATEVWNESLTQHPDQPEIVQTLQAIKSKSGHLPGTVAKGETPATKTKALQ